MGFETISPKLLPPKVVFYTTTKFGKTTTGVQAKGAFILMSKLETGYRSLCGIGSVPVVPSVVCETWDDVITNTREAIASEECKSIVFDALGGFEELCNDKVMKEQFSGDYMKFAHWAKGPRATLNYWRILLSMLEQCGKTIILLAHSRVKEFTPPDSEAYSQYQVAVYDKLWEIIDKWTDATLFGKFDVVVDPNTGRPMGGAERVIITGDSPAAVSGNRYQMDKILQLGDDPSRNWAVISNAITKNAAKEEE